MIGLNHTQSQMLQQKLAPQLIQSLHLLQLPTLELAELVQQELEVNPLLEIDEDATQDLEQEEEPKDELEDETEDEDRDEDPIEELEFEDADLDTLDSDVFDEQDWDHYLNESGYASPREEFEAYEDHYNESTAQKTLRDSLLEQVAITDLSPSDRIIAEYLIYNIDEDGFLGCSIGEVADEFEISFDHVERILGVIQTFDPIGVGSRNLQECLLIQLKEKNITNGLVTKVVRDHLDDWVNRRFSPISLALETSIEDLRVVEDVLTSLNPRPNIDPEPTLNLNHVIPDLEVIEIVNDEDRSPAIVNLIGGKYVVVPTERTLPELRVSPVYRTLLSQSDKSGRGDPKLRETKKFVVEKLNSARWFINAIHQRRITMVRVMESIVEIQLEFFNRGPGFLKPMVLKEVADKVQMHVSTISRVSNGKYVQTPHGVYELKYFFDARLSRDNDEDVSAMSVKDKIAKLIGDEDVQDPLSDQHIAEILKQEGINIARRTVAKYRGQLNIGSARIRKVI